MSKDNNLIEAYAAKRPQSANWFKRARAVLGGGVGHDLRYFEPVPLYIDRGVGGRKWDVDGNEYIDFLGGNGALLLGHAPPEIVAAIAEAVGRGTHFGNDHPLHIEWAELVQQLVPSAERVRFVNSGTEATLLAIRLARAFTGHSKILRFEGHFHGWHDDVVHGFHPPFDADGSLGVPPHVRNQMVAIADGDLNLVEDVLAREGDIAAAILEPSGASWGRVPLDPAFLRGLREITTRHKVPLIFDEVVTGFRFSPGGAQQLYGVLPDLTCLAKIIAGGMPGGAVVGSAEIMALFDITGDAHHDRHQRVVHFGTFNASPLSAAAGIAMLRRIATGQPIEQANATTQKLHAAWNRVLERQGIAGYVYGPASTVHVYFETDKDRVRNASTRDDLHTTDAARLKGMPAALILEYQRQLRYRGVDIMSSTGGVVSAVHNELDVEQATAAFEQTVAALRDQQLVLTMP
ncbi:MAG: aminotransferase class III-fold pyridoxal phosphate-dependent enzyme [Planctomycetota bacterium]|nr:aminotransferase class III-fold pyridoxal phosphate-dependent enzyme [Planctomycetota bacterium]